MKEMNLKPKDYRYAVFQQPYGFAPFAVGERLGFTKEQIEPGVVAPMIGDCGSASSLLGLIAVLDQAKKGDRIFLASYGFGAGSDALSLEVTAALEAKRAKVPLSAHLYMRRKASSIMRPRAGSNTSTCRIRVLICLVRAAQTSHGS